VAHRGAVPAAHALRRALVHGEDRGIPLLQRHDLAARLHARPLLDQHELAAGEVAARGAQQHHDLEREDHVAIEIAVQAVVVARPVAQQERRRPGLAGLVALLQPVLQGRREALRTAQPLAPLIGHPGQIGIERLAQPLDRFGKIVGEILVLALSVAMALHDDVFAEPGLLGPQRGQRAALVGADQAADHGEAAIREGFAVEGAGSCHADILTRRDRFFYP